MGHHGNEVNQEMVNLFKDEFIGATNKFPQGHLNPYDEGELKMAIVIEDKKVVLHFGKSIKWLGLDKQQAYDIANTIKEKADTLQK